MCEWGDTVVIDIDGLPIDVDRCISGIVIALNAAGLKTIASCCGHGKQPGVIALRDGREIRIFNTYEDSRKVDKLFPPINI